MLIPKDHRSSAQKRLRYRESAARYQTYLVAVRRVLPQRPGLRSAVSAGGEDAVVTDFAAGTSYKVLRADVAGPGPGLPARVAGVVRRGRSGGGAAGRAG